jgi:hypothetical protein
MNTVTGNVGKSFYCLQWREITNFLLELNTGCTQQGIAAISSKARGSITQHQPVSFSIN